jgi:hypothetical protein
VTSDQTGDRLLGLATADATFRSPIGSIAREPVAPPFVVAPPRSNDSRYSSLIGIATEQLDPRNIRTVLVRFVADQMLD